VPVFPANPIELPEDGYAPVYPAHPIELPPSEGGEIPGLKPEHPIVLPEGTVTIHVSLGPGKTFQVQIPKK
jgi:hypothetical protein